MVAAGILFAILIVAGTIFYLHDRMTQKKIDFRRDAGEEVEKQPILSSHSDDSPVCCGMHIVCEKDSLSTAVASEIDYYDDEELDRFVGRPAHSYSSEEVEEFRDILLTLIPTDIAGWGRSLQLRHIELPPEVRDELLMIVSEARHALSR